MWGLPHPHGASLRMENLNAADDNDFCPGRMETAWCGAAFAKVGMFLGLMCGSFRFTGSLRMENAFERLGLEPGLCFDEEVLRSAFREAGKREHPDAGGSEVGFAQARAAFELLSSPSRRLRHWVELRGWVVEPRGVVGPDLMDLFGRVGQLTQRAEVLARKRADARSALGLALLEGEVQRLLEEVAAVVGEVDAAMARETTGFAVWERSEVVEVEALARAVRNLAFLEKWRHALRGIPPRLV